MPPLDDMPGSAASATSSAPSALFPPREPKSVRNLHLALRAQVTETISTLREVVLMPRDLGPVVPREVRCEDDLVVVVHGIFASAGVFRPMTQALVSATGTGVTTWQGLDINRFREDPVLGAGGVYLYIKNRTHNRLWSTGYQPTRAEPSFYNVAFSIDRAKWGPRTRQVQSTRPATDGTYSFSVFAGEY